MPRRGSPGRIRKAIWADRRARRRLAALSVLAWPGAVAAQSYQCRIPDRVAVTPELRDGPVRRLPITGYTLALSWSPEYCRSREDSRKDRRQCSGRAGHFGLVVHGLWPESGRSWPQWCRAGASARPQDVRPNLCLTPSAQLLAHEWAKHGSCMTRRPATYFRVTRILYEGLRLPDLDRLSREDALTAGTIRERFAEANPGWFAQAVGIHTNARGWLEEIRLCYDRRFMPEPCDRSRHGAKDSAAVKIWRGL